MVFQVLGYVTAFVLIAYLLNRCFGRALTDRTMKRRQWAIEQAKLHYVQIEEYDRRKAAGLPVGPRPRMPLKVAAVIYDLGGPVP